MKILIVDDEELTRNGLLRFVNWTSLGIHTILQAEDGLKALEIVYKEQPELVLCDVRMPRMNGITLAERILEYFPTTAIIFMSGYSDKEYLKAAIKLKAVSYVEKPLNPAEIEETVLDAIAQHKVKLQTQKSEVWRAEEVQGQIAMLLTLPFSHYDLDISELCLELNLTEMEEQVFTAFLVKAPVRDHLEPGIFHSVTIPLKSFLKERGLSVFSTERHSSYIIFHVFGNFYPTDMVLAELSDFLVFQFSRHGEFFYSHGESVKGISHAYDSYRTAAFLMQSSFFFGSSRMLSPDVQNTSVPAENAPDPSALMATDRFYEAIHLQKEDLARQFLQDMDLLFRENTSLLPDMARDTYYKMYTYLEEHVTALAPEENRGNRTLLTYLESFHTYAGMHEDLCQQTEHYFRLLDNQKEENATITAIHSYINNNLGNSSLSVKDISDHVYLSTSYLCTFFKSETGKTLNQYITECRIARAKELLQNPKYKIADISSLIGYSDGNYFGKSFKKAVGLSPSEYRERMMR